MSDKIYELKLSVSGLFKKRCYICHRSIKPKKGFVYHHLWYGKNEVYYKDFKRPLEYQMALIPRVKKRPAQFLLLCGKHHHALEALNKYGKDTLRRLIMADKKTREARHVR